MKRLIRQTAVIARRDFIATVATPTFLLFLMAPFFMLAFGLAGGLGASQMSQGPAVAAEIVALVPKEEAGKLIAADRALRAIYRSDQAPPPLRIHPAAGAETHARAQALFKRSDVQTYAVLYGPLDQPSILSAPGGGRTAAYLGQLAENVLRDARGGIAPGERLSHATVTAIDAPAPSPRAARQGIGFAAVFTVFFLTLLLAGQAVGMMAEEKGNKVIEILAAAVPLEAVFLGKLIGMFGVALLFIAFWGVLALLGLSQLPADAPSIASLNPAIGMPAFVLLAAAYFTMAYLLLGAVFLGVGAQAATVREIQMLSLPITIFQVAMFGLSSAAASNPGSTLALVAETFPFSSPFAMAAHGATDARVWPHLLALGWQLIWVALVITLAARMFRRGVLKSGSGPLFGRTKAAA
ncbi:ABC transporter permease [Sphingomonas cavernae]|uniref:ABC transporter permease n=1 Tax=Sphingomonas cavernae TaxID=2320861 RepID=A0A418WQP3_9SPHN|nr:ABC transporter permease [Sphingomonas cavernae]RJF93531.1 ABC transporter permease [Sphingomonas cavernae]